MARDYRGRLTRGAKSDFWEQLNLEDRDKLPEDTKLVMNPGIQDFDYDGIKIEPQPDGKEKDDHEILDTNKPG